MTNLQTCVRFSVAACRPSFRATEKQSLNQWRALSSQTLCSPQTKSGSSATGFNGQQRRHQHGSGSSPNTKWRLSVGAGAAVAVGGLVFYKWERSVGMPCVHAATAERRGASEDFMLYWGSGSPFCWRVMIALEEKGLWGYGHKLLSMQDGDFRSAEVTVVNPRQQAPSFRHGKTAVNESLAACDYLEHTFKKQGTQLLPEDREALALVLQRKYESLNLYTKGIFDVFFYTRGSNVDQAELKKRKQALAAELTHWENYLAKQGSSGYIAGRDFSMADVVFFPGLAMLVRLGLRLDSRPHLQAYYDRLSQRPSVKTSWPPHWQKSPPSIFVFSDV